MGLSFSVPPGVRPPSSLINIFKELQSDLGHPPPGHGDLTHWAQQVGCHKSQVMCRMSVQGQGTTRSMQS